MSGRKKYVFLFTVAVLVQLVFLHLYCRPQGSLCGKLSNTEGTYIVQGKATQNASTSGLAHGLLSYSESIKRMQSAVQDSIYRYDRRLNLPLLKLTRLEQNRTFRIAEARKWLKSQKLVVAATVRNAMNGLESSVTILRSLGNVFQSVTVVFVENDSTDTTRSYLYKLTKQNTSDKFRVLLLGCDTINSPNPCHISISYGSSGRQHHQGHQGQAGRNLAEESTDRGMVMGALRNIYLQFIYDNMPDADLLLVLESDLQWVPWDLDSVVQGLHHFKAKPKLDSLCGCTMWGPAYNQRWGRYFHDPCTAIFYHNNYFYIDASERQIPFIPREGEWNKLFETVLGTSSGRNGTQSYPVKVASCFQGAAFYRMSSLRAASAFYSYSEGEWHCEHSTLSKQLRENYLDTEMRLQSNGQAAG